MNIFYLDSDIDTCAEMHCDKHVVKMVLEYAQLLSTAHRVLDGIEYIEIQNNRRVVRWRLSDLSMESMIYKATHINHPSAVWVRSSIDHYNWLSGLLTLCECLRWTSVIIMVTITVSARSTVILSYVFFVYIL